MDAATAAIYEAHAHEWIAARRPRALDDGRLRAFARRVCTRRVGRGGRVADLGCGPGWYAAVLQRRGLHVVALDVAAAMLAEAGRRVPGVDRVRADLAALPVRDRSLDGAWAENCYCHVPRLDLPFALARLHFALRPGALVELTLPHLEFVDPTVVERALGEAERRFDDRQFPGRLFSAVTPQRARALLVGAGFERIRVEPGPSRFWLSIRARRARSLPDLVGPDLRLLICGLNPSLYSADVGVPFARSGNRFWRAARKARLIVRERDPLDAFRRGLGMTDLVKRATAASGEISHQEYTRGLHRVADLVRRYRPRAICFVGLEGWRTVVDRRAQPGWLPEAFGGRPAYLMPSTSGRNARVSPNELAAHLRAAAPTKDGVATASR